MNARIKIHTGDITTFEVDAIVNAANSSLQGGGGVDGAIHRAAGPELKAYCKQVGTCPTGEARITPGFELPAKHVIHTVGPVWYGGQNREAELLAACYTNSLQLAADALCRTIAFPAISTGAYRFPANSAAEIAYQTISRFLDTHTLPETVHLVFFDERSRAVFERAVLS
jgi:O-acetyl-ADP-ribose deacetylase (regulator of RNase III)